MPLYSYKCKHCEHKFDELKAVKDRNGVKCPRCHGDATKLISVPGLQTDTSFIYTGQVDKRLGKRPIEGRRDWEKRAKDKGLVPLTKKDLQDL